MRNLVFTALALTALTACAQSPKEEQVNTVVAVPEKAEAAATLEVSAAPLSVINGRVVAKHMQGKDGSSWRFLANTGTEYILVASIPNLGVEQGQNIGLVKQNAVLSISGETFSLGTEQRLIARSIQPLE